MNNKLQYSFLGALFLIVALAGCSSVSVKSQPPTPQSDSILKPNIISGVEVSIAPMHEDRVRILEKNKVPALIKKSMTDSLKKGGYLNPTKGTYLCKVEIDNFVQSRWTGGTQVSLKVSVLDKSKATVKEVSASSISLRSGGGGMSATFSQAVQKALDRL